MRRERATSLNLVRAATQLLMLRETQCARPPSSCSLHQISIVADEQGVVLGH
jgi:hypothetical protein